MSQPNEKPPAKATSTQRIYDAVCELHELEQVATRETVAELTGLKLSVVDDRLGALVDEGKLKRVLRGIYVPVETHPPTRSISKTVLPDGCVKVEVGDEVLTLTPREDRILASLLAGAATHAAAIESGRQTVTLVTEYAARISRVENIVRAAMARDIGMDTSAMDEHTKSVLSRLGLIPPV